MVGGDRWGEIMAIKTQQSKLGPMAPELGGCFLSTQTHC